MMDIVSELMTQELLFVEGASLRKVIDNAPAGHEDLIPVFLEHAANTIMAAENDPLSILRVIESLRQTVNQVYDRFSGVAV